MRDFVTDGSIAGLCDRLTRLTGAPIWLRDASGQVIVPGEDGVAWRLVDADVGIARAFALVNLPAPAARDSEGIHSAEMRISTGALGAIEVCISCAPGVEREDPRAEARTIRDAVTLLASSVCDVCEAQVSLRRRVTELDALYRLSSLLAQTADLDELLRDAVHLAVATLGARGGLILLTDRAPAVRVQVGLSEAEAAALAGALESATAEGFTDGVALRLPGPLTIAPLHFHARTFGVLALVGRDPALESADGSSRGLLHSFADHIASAVSDARLRRLREEHERVQQQVRLAADVQRRMLPRQDPRVPGLDVAARYTPSFELGGDFYDFLDLGGNLGVAVGDVVGTGVAAALLISAVRASLRAHAEDVYDLKDVLWRVNRALTRDTDDDEFTTLFYGVIDPVSLRLTYVSAGHDPALLLRASAPGERPRVMELHSGGMVLGVDPAQTFPPGIEHLRRGDALLLYTDGLTEAADFQNRRFGRARLKEVLAELLTSEPDATAARMIEQVVWHLRQFAGLSTRTDDVTIVAIRVTG
jgi:serine phosphatase RsbU (regulator of sigma subunit)